LAIAYGGAGGFSSSSRSTALLVARASTRRRPTSSTLPAHDGRRPPGGGLRARLRTAETAGLEVAPPALKRAPKGGPPDHPRIGRLRLKELTVYHRHALEPWAAHAHVRRARAAELDAARPLVRWLGEYVGALPAAYATR